jgi:hypothetical protein
MFQNIIAHLQRTGESVLWRILFSIFLLSMGLFSIIQLLLLFNVSLAELENGKVILAATYSVLGVVSLGILVVSLKSSASEQPKSMNQPFSPDLPSGQMILYWLLQGIVTGLSKPKESSGDTAEPSSEETERHKKTPGV